MRLDLRVAAQFGARSRTYACNLIKKGKVAVDGTIVTKPSCDVGEEARIEIIEDEGYASQGAYKLDAAFSAFNLGVSGKRCADIGCSNGGFTDYLLRSGAASVLAIDVGECALPERLTCDLRVTFLRANARDVAPELFGCADFVCCDVSFISLKHILGGIYSLLKDGGEAVALIKPQFELDKRALNKKGIVTSEKDRERAVGYVRGYAADAGFILAGLTPAPIYYADKNVEYLLYLKKPESPE